MRKLTHGDAHLFHRCADALIKLFGDDGLEVGKPIEAKRLDCPNYGRVRSLDLGCQFERGAY